MSPIFSYTINDNLIWVDLREIQIMKWDSKEKYGEVFLKGSDAEVKFGEEEKKRIQGNSTGLAGLQRLLDCGHSNFLRGLSLQWRLSKSGNFRPSRYHPQS